MSVKQVQICIVSAEPMANILPIKALKPDRVMLVVSDRMREAGELLNNFLQQRGIKTVTEADAPDHDLAAIREFAMQRIQDMTSSGIQVENITLNATGGNKLMAMGFVEAAREFGKIPIVYCATAHDRLEYIAPSDKGALPLERLTSFKDLVECRGLGIKQVDSRDMDWKRKAVARQAATLEFVRLTSGSTSVIKNIRRHIFGQTSKGLQKIPDRLVSVLQEVGVVPAKPFTNSKRLKVADESSRHYLGGGWLEEYVWLSARGLADAEYYTGVELYMPETPVESDATHEFDLAIASRNRLVIGECKVSLKGGGAIAECLHRLKALNKDIGGPFGRVILICPEHESRARLRARCLNGNIAFVGRKELPSLGDWLERFTQGI